jgi:CRP-like cAMP-binding protein
MPHSFTSEAIFQPDFRQLLEQLYQGQGLHSYRGGQTIQMFPHEVWVVCRGVVQLSTLYQSGDEALLGLAGPSMPFGLPLTFIHPYQATALSDADLLRLTLADIEQSPTLAQGIFRPLIRRLQQTEAMLSLVGHRRVKDRLCQLLRLLMQEVGHPVPGGIRLSVRLTHQHLANAIGTTRVTITRLLGQLREEGWLNIDSSNHIVIPHQVIPHQTVS